MLAKALLLAYALHTEAIQVVRSSVQDPLVWGLLAAGAGSAVVTFYRKRRQFLQRQLAYRACRRCKPREE